MLTTTTNGRIMYPQAIPRLQSSGFLPICWNKTVNLIINPSQMLHGEEPKDMSSMLRLCQVF